MKKKKEKVKKNKSHSEKVADKLVSTLERNDRLSQFPVDPDKIFKLFNK